MAYVAFNASQDLSAGPMNARTTFGEDVKLGLVCLQVKNVASTELPDNPQIGGLMENVQVWIVNPSDSTGLSNIQAHASGFKGRQSHIWAPEGNWTLPSGYELNIKVTNSNGTGIINCTVLVEPGTSS